MPEGISSSIPLFADDTVISSAADHAILQHHLKLVLLLHWKGSMISDVNTMPGSTHCTTNGQGSAAARNNIGQLMSTVLHYSELKLLHSGDIQPNPGPVSSESQGHASVLASDMPRGSR